MKNVVWKLDKGVLNMSNIFDVVIIGAGPAGLSAGLYAGRSKLKTLMIEKEKDGGQIVSTDEVENYPGAPENSTGPSLVKRMVEQAKHFGVERTMDAVLEIKEEDNYKLVVCEKETYKTKSVIVAAGAKPKTLGCPGEKEFTGKGVSYCATCDAAFFEDFEIFVIGGGDSAVEEAIYLTKFARKVTIVYRRDKFRAAKSIADKALANPKIQVMWNTEVKEIKGEGIVQEMTVFNNKTGVEKVILADEEDGMFGVFMFVGYEPLTGAYEGYLDMENGYILTDDDMRTNVKGVFAAGDCRKKSLRQVITACADGAIAATQAEKYIEEIF